jgi:hypothetical protein
MKRLIAALVGLLAAAGPVAVATASRGHRSGIPVSRAGLHDLVCQRALDPPARAMNITVIMRPLSGTQRLAMKVQLLERAAGAGSYTPVPGTDLGVWQSPTNPPTLGQQPGDKWVAYHPVADLAAPAGYRYEVSFRWYGADGKVIGAVTRLSKVCFQRELRPDLTVDSVSVAPVVSHPNLDAYTAVVGDSGATGAGPFTVRLSADGATRERTVQHIHAHATRTVVIEGPLCRASSPPVVTVDPDDQVDVYSRSQASASVACPVSGSGAATGRRRR